jgi:cytoskeletal protein RodZ
LIAKARKDAGCSIDELAEATNLRATLLREIEKDDFSHCGGNTYARGHVHNIAKALKADEKEFVRIFDEEQGTIKRTIRDLLVENSVMRTTDTKRKISWKVLLLISVACLAIAGIAQIVISNISSIDSAVPTVSASSSPTDTPAASASESAQPTAQSSFSTGTGVSVIVSAVRAKSWLFVSDASGRTLFSGQISMGSSLSFTTDTRLDLKVGNAGGVDLQVNGKKTASIGVDGAVVSVSYGVDS